MGYIEKNLISGETILYKTRLHSVAVVLPLLFALLVATAGIYCLYAGASTNQGEAGGDPTLWAGAGSALLLIAAISTAIALMKRNATEMAVTNRRIIIKSGILSRRTIEMLLSRVESIAITESFLGRMFGYGTVVVRGTGGTPEPFNLIANPTDFRRHVQEQIEAGQTPTRVAGNIAG